MEQIARPDVFEEARQAGQFTASWSIVSAPVTRPARSLVWMAVLESEV